MSTGRPAPLFDRLPPDLFRPLGSANSRRYWAVLSRLMEEMWGDGGRSPGEEAPRQVVVRMVESYLVASDPWEEDLETPVSIRSHGIVNLLTESGWLSQRRRGMVDMITVRPVIAQFYTVLCEFAEHEPKFIGSEVRSIYLSLRSVAAGESSGDQYRFAARQAKACMAHIANTGCRVQDLMDDLMTKTSARDFVRGFFEEYVEKVFIADYSELRTKDHPLQHRSAILSLALQFQHDVEKREELIGWYQANTAQNDRIKAELHFDRDTRLLFRLRDVDDQLRRLDEEIRDANQRAIAFIEYKLRAPKHLDKLITKAISAAHVLEEGHIALPPAPGLRHASEYGLAKPRSVSRPLVETKVEQREPTPEELAMEVLRRRMADNRMVKPVHLAQYVSRHLAGKSSISSDDLTIGSINDLCCYQRLLLIASRSGCPASMRKSDPQLQMLSKVRIELVGDQITTNAFMEHNKFNIQLEHA